MQEKSVEPRHLMMISEQLPGLMLKILVANCERLVLLKRLRLFVKKCHRIGDIIWPFHIILYSSIAIDVLKQFHEVRCFIRQVDSTQVASRNKYHVLVCEVVDI